MLLRRTSLQHFAPLELLSLSGARFYKHSAPLELKHLGAVRLRCISVVNYSRKLPIPETQRDQILQNVNFTANCNCLGSPTPCRRKPLKSNSADPMVGSILLAVLNVLNISTMGISAYRSPKRNGLCKRQSSEKYSLFFRASFRGKQRVAHPGDFG